VTLLTAYGMAASAMFLPSTAGKDDSWSSPRTTVRTFFPETWLWNDILIGYLLSEIIFRIGVVLKFWVALFLLKNNSQLPFTDLCKC